MGIQTADNEIHTELENSYAGEGTSVHLQDYMTSQSRKSQPE